MNDVQTRRILENQIEIMATLALLLRYAKPDLVGKAGELDAQRDDLYQCHKATQRALAVPNERQQTEQQRIIDEAYKRFPDDVEPVDYHPAGKIVVDRGNLRFAFLEGARFALSVPNGDRA